MRPIGWWGSKVRQFRAYVRARVTPGERAELETWLTGPEIALFERMHLADQRHGLDVVATLRADGVGERDVLVAGLLHDAGKGRQVGLWPRVAWSLGEALGPWVMAVPRHLPGFGPALDRLRDHAALSAALAAEAGCTERTVALIRDQAAPTDRDFGELLRLADEAN